MTAFVGEWAGSDTRQAGRRVDVRDDDIVTAAALIADDKLLPVHGELCAFSQAEEGAGNRLGAVIVDDDEFVAGGGPEPEGGEELAIGDLNGAGGVELITIDA